jgi:recombinational DNA repair ATPase RecF
MSEVLRIGRNREQFLELIDEALQESGSELARARQDSVRNGTWDARAEWVSDLIEEALLKRK